MAKKPRDYVLFYLNGERIEVRGEQNALMVSDYLRYEKGLTGTKIVCAEGDCGACTVLRKYCGPGSKSQIFEPVNSCIMTVGQLDGSNLVTVEYLSRKELSPVQKAFVDCHGSQCGFCTPGFVMALSGLVEKKKSSGENQLKEKEVKNALTGNLCRCTGYQQIIDAALAVPVTKVESLAKVPEIQKAEKELRAETKVSVSISTPKFQFYAPLTLKEALQILASKKDVKILGAGTDLGVLVNKGKAELPVLLSLHLAEELYAIKKTGTRLQVGARVSLERLRKESTKFFPVLASFLDVFASPQIKNVATLVGNIANASPIGDTLPFLLSMNATLTIQSAKKKRVVNLDEFFLGYRKTDLKKDEVITQVEFDLPKADDKIYLLKSSQRKDLDISAVNGAIRLNSKQSRVALGGVGATPLRLKKLEKFLEDNSYNESTLKKAVEILQAEIHPLSDLRASQSMRRLLSENFLKQSLSNFMAEST